MGGIPVPLCTTRFLYVPGTSGSYASTPDSVAASITGNIDIRIRVTLDDYTNGATQTLIAKYQTSGQFSWAFSITSAGALSFIISQDGTNQTVSSTSAAPSPALVDGTAYWFRIASSFSGGTATNKFYTCTSNLAANCTQVGTDRTGSATGFFDGTSVVEIGTRQGGTANRSTGRYDYADIRSGVDGTPVVVFDPQGGNSFTSTTGEVWTINGGADIRRECGG